MNPRIYTAGAGLAALLGAAMIVPAGAQASEATVNVVHGIPGGPAVDVCVDGGDAVVDGAAPGDRAAVETALPAGTYGVVVAEDTDANDCAGTEVAAADLTVEDGQTSIDVVAGLDDDGNPTLLPFVNDDAATAAEEGRISVRHAGDAGAIDAFVDEEQVADGATNGEQGGGEFAAGAHELTIFPADTTDDPLFDAETIDLAAGTSELRYVVGTAGDDAEVLAFTDEVGTEDDGDADGEVTARRLAGIDREETAAQISEETYPEGNDVVYLARRDVENGPDSLSAVTLQGGPEEVQGPVLLVASCGYGDGSFLTDATAAELERLGSLGTDDVVALGGDRAICGDAVDAAVDAVVAGQDG